MNSNQVYSNEHRVFTETSRTGPIDAVNRLFEQTSVVDLTLFVGGALLNKKYGNSIEMLEEYDIKDREIEILEPGVNELRQIKQLQMA